MTEETQREIPEEIDWKPYYTVAHKCGWCDTWVAATTGVGVHVRLLWHQWWNHRDRIWEEY